MSEPVPGDPQVDVETKELVDKLRGFYGKTAKNLDFKLLGELVEQSARVFGIATRYQTVNMAKKLGGHIGAGKSQEKIP